MFFEPRDFKELPDPANKRAAAIVANRIVAELGVNLFGRYHADGMAVDFSTEMQETDTHSCIAIDLQAMGMKRRHSAPIQMEMQVSQEDKDDMDKEYIKQLERENKNLRSQRGE